MRNDARPIGEDSATQAGRAPRDEKSPVDLERRDALESVAKGRRSHIVNREAEQDQPKGPDDPVTPSSDRAPHSKI